MINRAYLSLGSNISPEHYLPRAVTELASLGRVAAVSRVWQSPAIGRPYQADYCNAAVLLETAREGAALVGIDGLLRELESRLDRVRDPEDKYAARTIDIDLSLWNREQGVIGGKTIPDPDLFTRACIAVPLAELPDAELPTGVPQSLQAIARELLQTLPLTSRPDIDRAIAVFRR